jgi:hypothetical protein
MAKQLPPQPRLSSWKEIADYLERDVRTAMRWAKADGLPVYRAGAGTRRAVYAFAVEIDEWLVNGRVRSNDGNGREESEEMAASPVRTFPWHPAWIALAGVVLLGGFAIASRLATGRSAIVRAAVVGRDVVALDAAGRDIWRREIAGPEEHTSGSRVQLVQWDAAAPLEVLVATSIERPPGDGTGALMLFGADGSLRWRRAIEDRYSFGGTEYGPTWFPTDVRTFRAGSDVKIAATFHHHTWWPGLVSTFDRDGTPASTFVNPGWMHHLNVTRDGRYLLAAGVSNALGGAVLAVLDASRPSGTSPADAPAFPTCADCPSGVPAAYFLVPWSDVARPSDTPPVVVQVADSGEIQLRAAQRLPRDGVIPELILTLSPSLQPLHRKTSDAFNDVHAVLERGGELGHPAAQCPWRTPPARVWTSGQGWRTL